MADDAVVAIFTIDRDVHAYAVRHELNRRGVRCSLIEVDDLCARGDLSWSPTENVPSGVRDIQGRFVDVSQLRVIWWRRTGRRTRVPAGVSQDAAVHDLVTNDTRSALLGLVLQDFAGTWVSHPEATRRAENKLVQLQTARDVGMRIPRTLVSQDPEKIRAFAADLDDDVIVKVVRGTPLAPVLTGHLERHMLDDAATLRLSPAIYQERVPGGRHLRVCVFGKYVHTVMLESPHLDWRYPLDAKASVHELDDRTADMLRTILDRLGLRMGVIDLKLTADGEPVWLEVNPQGQFMFLDEMCDASLTQAFVDFLVEEAAVGC